MKIEKRCSLSVFKFHDTLLFFSYHRGNPTQERGCMSTTCSYFEMTNTMMKQKKFPIKINHMSDFSSESASSQLRKYALAVDHRVNTYLLYSKWPMEKQTEIWAGAEYENKQKSLPRATQLMLLPMYPWKKNKKIKMHTSPCLRQCLITLYQNNPRNSRPRILHFKLFMVFSCHWI